MQGCTPSSTGHGAPRAGPSEPCGAAGKGTRRAGEAELAGGVHVRLLLVFLGAAAARRGAAQTRSRSSPDGAAGFPAPHVGAPRWAPGHPAWKTRGLWRAARKLLPHPQTCRRTPAGQQQAPARNARGDPARLLARPEPLALQSWRARWSLAYAPPLPYVHPSPGKSPGTRQCVFCG